jgi:hypothetical protein
LNIEFPAFKTRRFKPRLNQKSQVRRSRENNSSSLIVASESNLKTRKLRSRIQQIEPRNPEFPTMTFSKRKSEPNKSPERNDHEPSFGDGFRECFSRLFSLVVVAQL